MSVRAIVSRSHKVATPMVDMGKAGADRSVLPASVSP